jgi:3-oxoacyl-[acyl-carrier-protein] synthase-3
MKSGGQRFAKILGVGAYVPERVLTNADLCAMVDTSDEWIRTRTGIVERRIASDGQATSDLCTAAAQMAMDRASIAADGIDLVIISTLTPDMPTPNTSVLVQHKLGMDGIPCMDFNVACSGFQYGLELSRSLISSSGRYNNILLVCGDKLSTVVDWQDRSTCILFGDGAGAVVLSATENANENSIVDVMVGANGKLSNLLRIPAGGSAEPSSCESVTKRRHFMQMNGRDVFREAVRTMESCAAEILRKNGMTVNDVDFVIPHQANIRIIEALGERLKIPAEKLCITIERYGNTSSSSSVIAMSSLVESGQISTGSVILSVGFGAGLTWGASILKF